MRILNNYLLLIALVTALFWTEAGAQETFRLQSKSSSLVIEGSSSIHEWEMEVTGFHAETLMKLNGEKIGEISRIEFQSPVSGLKSGKNIMDNKAHDALKKKKFPEIKFILDPNSAVNISGEKANITGMLTIAGKTKKITLSADFKVEAADRFQVSGSVPLNMSDFGIDPPTAMLGALKTDDHIKINFNLEFQQSDQEFSHNY
jgi:polyisoprenoid-binding protein YceI